MIEAAHARYPRHPEEPRSGVSKDDGPQSGRSSFEARYTRTSG